jgi:hypothetical protein
MTSKPSPKPIKNGLRVIGKLYPSKVVTRDGKYYIGDYTINIDNHKIPFNSRDNVDYYLTNIFDYVRDAASLDRSKPVIMEKYFKNFINDVQLFLPVKQPKKVEETQLGGKRRTRKNRKTKSKRGKTGKKRK